MACGKISFGGASLDNVPRWVVTVTGCVLAAAMALTAYMTVWKRPTDALVTLQEANDVLRAEMDEYNLHIAEPAETSAVLLDDARGKLTISRYADGCILLARSVTNGKRAKLILDLARDQHAAPRRSGRWFEVPVVAAAPQCLNPHPGAFRTWNGQRQGCFVQVWRQWPDGCTHVQMFDTCHGVWDLNVNWTTCVH